MNSEEWRQIKDIFSELIELPESERTAFLDKCDVEFRGEVEKLINANNQAGEFINEPALVDVGLAEEHQNDPYLGERIDAYKILEEIGHGGMGTVYLATRADEAFDKHVAIKLIRRGMDTTAVLKRFVMERQILAQLENPNIASLLDGGSTADGLPYLVMEYIEGEPITTFCDSHQFSIRERLELFQKVCSAVSYAHQNLVVHRDLKPSNILVTEDGMPKLLDFGIAKLLHPDWSLDTNEATATMFRVMTPEYASPEQLRGLPITTASDVYSLGVVLYELLTGERPFKMESRTPDEVARVVVQEEPIKPSSVINSKPKVGISKPEAETLPYDARQTVDDAQKPKSEIQNLKSLRGDLDNIILKALRKEPERRYSSVQEFSQDIRRHLEGLPVTASPDTLDYRVGKFVTRHKAGVLAAVIVLLTLLTATTITAWQARVARRERARAEQRFNDVRKLANSVVFELHDSIQNLPGSTPARELLVNRALEYLDKLANEAGQDRSLQLELAAAYDKIGDIQGGLNTSHLGQRQKAGESYRKALAITEALVGAEPNNVEFRRKLSTSYTKMGDAMWIETDPKGSLQSYGKALEIDKQLSTEFPNDKEIRFDLAVGYSNFGYMLGASGRLDEAMENSRKGVALLEGLAAADPNNNNLQHRLAISYDKMAEIITSLTENHSEALLIYRKSQEIDNKLLLTDPLNTTLRRGVAVSYLSVAQVSAKLGDTKTALESSLKALSVFQQMLSADPQNDEFRQLVANVQAIVSMNMIRSGKAVDAIKLLNQSLVTLEKSFAASPSDNIAHFHIGNVQEYMGQGYAALAADVRTSVQMRLANWREARSWFEKSLKIFTSFRDAGKTTGEEAAKVDAVTREIAKCDAAIARLTGK